jgi:hypothetical protein
MFLCVGMYHWDPADVRLKESILRAIHWCATYATINRAWDQLRKISPDARMPFPFNLSHWQLRKWLEMEARLEVQRFDCCPSGWLAYTGPYSENTACESCGETRYRYVRQVRRFSPRAIL